MLRERQTALTIGTADDQALLALVKRVSLWAGGFDRDGMSPRERQLLSRADSVALPPIHVAPRTDDGDLFGDVLTRLRLPDERRALGQFLTPQPIVNVMVDWVTRQRPGQVIDPGCGTGRFAVAAARAMPHARVLAVDMDPVATIVCRAYAQRLRLSNLEVYCADFLSDPLPLDGSSAVYVGNPPYVRHHRLAPRVKRWGASASAGLGIPFSKLAGLHVYFLLATALRARPGDGGCYITSAEWLDVRYGAVMRRLLSDRLGLLSLCVLVESVPAFDDAMTTAGITCFRVGGGHTHARFSVVTRFTNAEGPKDATPVPLGALTGRWSRFVQRKPSGLSRAGWVRLGDLVSVHRGIATGANEFFLMSRAEARSLGLESCVKPVITSARQILEGPEVVQSAECERLLVLPRDLGDLPSEVRKAAHAYLARGEAAGVQGRYLCRHRRPWWWLGNTQPPPIVASYMARRPPRFATNPDGALILNIAHGLFPREPFTPSETTALVRILNTVAGTFVGRGRRYHGGLEKFEPREMEDLLMPRMARNRGPVEKR